MRRLSKENSVYSYDMHVSFGSSYVHRMEFEFYEVDAKEFILTLFCSDEQGEFVKSFAIDVTRGPASGLEVLARLLDRGDTMSMPAEQVIVEKKNE